MTPQQILEQFGPREAMEYAQQMLKMAQDFKDTGGRSAVPFLLVFSTKNR